MWVQGRGLCEQPRLRWRHGATADATLLPRRADATSSSCGMSLCSHSPRLQLLSFSSDQPEVIARVEAINARMAELELNANAFKAAVEVRGGLWVVAGGWVG